MSRIRRRRWSRPGTCEGAGAGRHAGTAGRGQHHRPRVPHPTAGPHRRLQRRLRPGGRERPLHRGSRGGRGSGSGRGTALGGHGRQLLAAGPLPADTETRIAAFTELVATAIANTEARRELEQVAAEHAALGRVATLVAEAVPPGDVFTAVAAEVAGLFGVPLVGLFRYEREGMATVIAGAGKLAPYLGRRWPCPAGDPGLVASVQRTGQPLRIDDYTQISSAISGPVREAGIGRRPAFPSS